MLTDRSEGECSALKCRNHYQGEQHCHVCKAYCCNSTLVQAAKVCQYHMQPVYNRRDTYSLHLVADTHTMQPARPYINSMCASLMQRAMQMPSRHHNRYPSTHPCKLHPLLPRARRAGFHWNPVPKALNLKHLHLTDKY